MYAELTTQTLNFFRQHRGQEIHWVKIYKFIQERNNDPINPHTFAKMLSEMKKKNPNIKNPRKGYFKYVLEDTNSAKITDFFFPTKEVKESD